MRKRFAIYAYWGLLVGVTFFTIYPAANWLTSQRSDLFHLYTSEELAIPFIPQFIWLYLSMNLLFLLPPFFLNCKELAQLGKQLIIGTIICGLFFLILPSSLGFERILPESSPYNQLFLLMFKMDYPHNLAPSLHVVFSTCIVYGIANQLKAWSYWMLMLWFGAIVASTLLVHQHHLIDIATGFVLALLLRHYIAEKALIG